MKKEKSCGSIIVDNGKALIIRQKNNGITGFPKGHMEKGETEEDTAIRETKEETGLDVILNTDKRYLINYIMENNIDKTVVYFLARLNGDCNIKLQDTEISDYEWVDIEEVYNVLMFDNIKALWLEVKNDISVGGKCN